MRNCLKTECRENRESNCNVWWMRSGLKFIKNNLKTNIRNDALKLQKNGCSFILPTNYIIFFLSNMATFLETLEIILLIFLLVSSLVRPHIEFETISKYKSFFLESA